MKSVYITTQKYIITIFDSIANRPLTIESAKRYGHECNVGIV